MNPKPSTPRVLLWRPESEGSLVTFFSLSEVNVVLWLQNASVLNHPTTRRLPVSDDSRDPNIQSIFNMEATPRHAYCMSTCSDWQPFYIFASPCFRSVRLQTSDNYSRTPADLAAIGLPIHIYLLCRHPCGPQSPVTPLLLCSERAQYILSREDEAPNLWGTFTLMNTNIFCLNRYRTGAESHRCLLPACSHLLRQAAFPRPLSGHITWRVVARLVVFQWDTVTKREPLANGSIGLSIFEKKLISMDCPFGKSGPWPALHSYTQSCIIR